MPSLEGTWDTFGQLSKQHYIIPYLHDCFNTHPKLFATGNMVNLATLQNTLYMQLW